MTASLSPSSSEKIITAVLNGEKRALAQLISRIENSDSRAPELISALMTSGRTSYIIGVTGPPGAGKSTITSRLVKAYRLAGKKVGVIAVDPTSPFTGGALLGDRIRMNDVMLDDGVFIRSMATRGSLGGLSRKASEAARALTAAGYEIIIFETVGVGQSELDIIGAADTTVVVLVPESGDAVQAMKAGLMEIADVFVMNKADRHESDKAVQAVEGSLALRDHTADSWLPPIVKTIALTNTGIAELVTHITSHRDFLEANGLLREKRFQRDKAFIQQLVEEAWRTAFWTASRNDELAASLERGTSPYQIAAALVAKSVVD
jgi:LAO/AO transport system kinase